MVANDEAVIAIDEVTYRWPGQSENIIAINELRLRPGEHLFVRGASGSGKSTLLNLLAGINTPQTGTVKLLGTDLASLSASRRDQFRADHLGVIFQQFNLLPYLTTLENVILACAFSERKKARAVAADPTASMKGTARALLRDLNLPDELHDTRSSNLSVGQQQRVAVARALIGEPEILLADEPTSALDADNRDRFLSLLFQEVEACGCTLVFVSHDPELAKGFGRSIELSASTAHTGGGG